MNNNILSASSESSNKLVKIQNIFNSIVNDNGPDSEVKTTYNPPYAYPGIKSKKLTFETAKEKAKLIELLNSCDKLNIEIENNGYFKIFSELEFLDTKIQ